MNDTTKTKKPTQAERIEELENQIANLTSLLQQSIEQGSAQTAVGEAVLEVREDDDRISPDKYISVMSLVPFNLNLRNGKPGRAGIREFNAFGQVKRLPYSEVTELIDLNWSFASQGYFIVLDDRVIRQHGLLEAYEQVLDKEKLEKAISANSQESFELFKGATPYQKEIIIDILTNKVKEDPESVDLNIVDKISRDAGVDIVQKAEDARELMKELVDRE